MLSGSGGAPILTDCPKRPRAREASGAGVIPYAVAFSGASASTAFFLWSRVAFAMRAAA